MFRSRIWFACSAYHIKASSLENFLLHLYTHTLDQILWCEIAHPPPPYRHSNRLWKQRKRKHLMWCTIAKVSATPPPPQPATRTLGIHLNLIWHGYCRCTSTHTHTHSSTLCITFNIQLAEQKNIFFKHLNATLAFVPHRPDTN